MSDPVHDDIDARIPLVLIGISLFLFAGAAFVWHGPTVFAEGGLVFLFGTVFQVVLGLCSCFLAARMLNASLGNTGTAVVKLTAVILFPIAVALTVTLITPFGSWLVMWGLWLGLIYALFDLDGWHPLAFVLILWGIKLLVEEVILDAIA
jgi:hypothetical protein